MKAKLNPDFKNEPLSDKLECSDTDTDSNSSLQGKVRKLEDVETSYLEFIRSIFDHSPVGVLVLDDFFRVVYVNPAICQFFGFKAKELLGRDKRQLIREKIKHIFEESEAFAKRVLSTYSKNTYIEKFDCHVLPDKGREERWLFHFSQPMTTGPFKNGRIEFYHDQTTQYHAMRQLFHERNLWNTLIRNIPDSIYIKDSQSRFLLINPVQARVLGIDDPSQAIGKTDFDFFPEEHAQKAFADEQRILKTGDPVINKLERVAYPDGKEEWYLTSKIPVYNAEGEIIGTMGSSRDITEVQKSELARRESEQRFKLLFEASHDGILILNGHGKILDANRTFQELSGFTGSELKDSFVDDYCAEDVSGFYERISSAGDSGLLFESFIRHKSGEAIPVEVSVSQMKVRNGAFIQMVFRDLRRRRAIEQAIQESEQKFRTLAEKSPNMIFIFQDGRLVYVNQRCEEILGYSREEFLKPEFKVHLIMAPESFPTFKKNYKDYLVNKSLTQDEYTFIRKNGEKLETIVNTQAIQYGGKEAVLGIITDITRLKRTEEKIRASEALYRAIFENTGTATAIVDKEGTILLVNSMFASLAGCSRKEIEGKKKWAEFVASEDRERMWEYHRKRSIDPRQAPRQYEFTFRRHTGEHGTGLITVSSIPGTEQRLISVIDITEQQKMAQALKESEEKYRNLIENSNDGIYLLYNGKFEVVNRKFCEMFGVTLEDLNAPDFDFKHLIAPRSLPLIEERERRLAAGQQLEQKYEFTAIASDGREIEVETSVSYIPYKDGVATQGIIRDITQRKKLEAQLNQAQKMEAVGRLAGGVAHDFNNLLTAISGYTQLILNDTVEDDPRYADLLEIRKAADRAAALTQQLLAFSRKQVVRPEILDINLVIEDMNRMLRRVIGEHIELVVLPGQGLRPIRVDRGQLEQVVVNLAVNARDAMPEGGKLLIATEMVDFSAELPAKYDRLEPGVYVKLSVEDNGEGIPQEVLPHLFEPFYTTKERGKGTGLGLAIVYGVVRQHGGSIFVESKAGQGSKFEVFFPALSLDSVPQKKTKISNPKLRGSESILLVEDEDVVRELTQSVLERHGYTVATARYGDEALRIVEQNNRHFDLIISDVIMPRMSGVEMVKQLGKRNYRAKVLFVSGYTEGILLPDKDLKMEQDFLQKPYSPQAILLKVRELLDR